MRVEGKSLAERLESGLNKNGPDHYGLGPCWMWTRSTCGPPRERGQITVSGRNRLVHRVAYELWVGPIPAGKVIMHRCDEPLCCRPDHLIVGTQGENVADQVAKGRKPQGTDVGWAKLTEDQVMEIRRNPSISLIEFARRFGVGQITVFHVRHRNTWKHLPEQEPQPVGDTTATTTTPKETDHADPTR